MESQNEEILGVTDIRDTKSRALPLEMGMIWSPSFQCRADSFEAVLWHDERSGNNEIRK